VNEENVNSDSENEEKGTMKLDNNAEKMKVNVWNKI
jgi:hypothetical protein